MSILENRNNIGNRGFISDKRTEDGLLKVHGIAIGNNDITRGSTTGERKLWRPEVLEESAHTLQGKDIVADHNNKSAYEKVGEVKDAKYDEEKGVIYQGVIRDEELEEKIEYGWLDVSPRLLHSKSHEERNGVKIPESIREFDNLSIVREGAAKSNTLEAGEHDDLSIEELQECFESEEACEYQRSLTEEEIEELQSAEDFDYSQWMYKDREGAEGASERFPCSGGSHKHEIDGETWWMPCSNHDSFLKALDEAENPEELAEFTQDDWVQWDWSGGKAFGKVTEIVSDGSRTVEGNTRTVSEDDGEEIVVIEQVDEEGESQDQRVIKIAREDGENENGLREWSPNSEEASEIGEFAMHGSEEMGNKEMKKVASQMASHSELTKSESMALMQTLAPGPMIDIPILSKAISSAIGADKERMERLMEHMSSHKESEMSSADVEEMFELSDESDEDGTVPSEENSLLTEVFSS